MKSKFILFFLFPFLVFSTASIFAQKTQDTTKQVHAKRIYSRKGRFKIFFPQRPKVSYTKFDTPSGRLYGGHFVSEGKKADYLLTYTDYPRKFFKKKKLGNMFEKTEASILKSFSADLEEMKPIKYKKYKGVWFRAKSDKNYIIFQILIIKKRVYQFGIVKKGAYPSAESAKKFFDSFEYIKEKWLQPTGF